MNSKLTRTRLMITIAGSALAVAALAGCSSPTTTTPSTGSSSGATAAPASSTEAKTATTSLGEIIVDGAGKTAYFFDKDTANSGTSACTGGCASLWPAIESATTTPVVEGITGTVGTIVGTDGGNQITINGRPIYTYTPDAAAGDVTGQGFGGVWWVVSPAGDEVKTPAASGY